MIFYIGVIILFFMYLAIKNKNKETFTDEQLNASLTRLNNLSKCFGEPNATNCYLEENLIIIGDVSSTGEHLTIPST